MKFYTHISLKNISLTDTALKDISFKHISLKDITLKNKSFKDISLKDIPLCCGRGKAVATTYTMCWWGNMFREFLIMKKCFFLYTCLSFYVKKIRSKIPRRSVV